MSQIKKEIHRELASIYFLNSKERDELFIQLDKLPEKALAEVLNVIKNAKKNQKKYLSKINEIDPQFTKKLEIFLDGNADVLIADSIMTNNK